MNPLISRFYDMGFSIIPTGPDKRPLIQWKDYQTRRATQDELNKWFVNGSNPAVVCGAVSSNLVIIDCDDPNVSNLLSIDTLTVRTPSGGTHLYVKSNVIPEKQQAYKGYALDIQADKAYALLPGSKTDKGEYVIIKDAPIKSFENIIEYLDKKLTPVSDNRDGDIQTFKKNAGMDIMTRYVNFEVIGHNYKQSKCPFHGDTDPSFTVYDNGYYCYGCGEHGDIISFVMKKEGVNFKQAVNKISEITGIKAPELKKEPDVKNGKQKKIKEPIKLPDIPIEEINPNPITIQEVLDIYKKYQYIEEDVSITIPLSETISNFAPIEPDIMGIIGASGSGKTEFIRALGEMENQYVYPVSSITGHTLVSGFEDNIDLAPSLRGRLLTIKDFTSLISKKADEVSEIFADFRELTDGHIGKDFGSGVKKHYTGIHTSILFGCTNAIEKYNSMFSLLGQRILFFRPRSDRKKAMNQAMKNAGREAEFRDVLHKTTMQFINNLLTTQQDRLKNLSHIQDEYVEEIGNLVMFLSIVRTHIDRDFKGDMARLPEPEYPTRLAKTICKLVDAHSILYNRQPNDEDMNIAYRLILDNIPTERLKILNTLTDGDEKDTSKIHEEAKVSVGFARRVLEDLKALEIIEFTSNGQGRSDTWQFTDENNRAIILKIQNFGKQDFVNKSTDSDELRGVNRLPDDTDTRITRFTETSNNNIKSGGEKVEYQPVSELHPTLKQEAEIKNKNCDSEICGICGKSLVGHDNENIGHGLGVVHTKCKYSPIKVKALVNMQYFSNDTHSPIELKKDNIAGIPALQALNLITKQLAERVN